jgi:hypothetical protein
MTPKPTALLDSVERKPLKCAMRRTTDSFARAGQLVEQAINRAYPKAEAAADDYGTTHSLMSRQMTNQDNQHLSFQRLWSMPEPFKLELVTVLLQDLKASGGPIDVETTVRIRRTA